jgi:4-alpha-glucanotransferase
LIEKELLEKKEEKEEQGQEEGGGEKEEEDEAEPVPLRYAGIILHPTSLPGRFGIGALGPEAYRFVDFLAAAGQSLWQVMPLGPTGFGNSPYAVRSAFAGNPLLISQKILVEEGLIEAEELARAPAFPVERVDFEPVIAWKEALLSGAYRRFRAQGRIHELDPFIEANQDWLPDFCLYMAIRHEDSRAWHEWPKPLATREPTALASARRQLADLITYHAFLQSRFADHWSKLKARANQSGVRILGDIPIFPAHDSADVWANQRIFKLDPGGQPEVVAGVPPDYFSKTGQLWGNPVYRWDVLKQEKYRWWVDRFRRTFELVDIVRLDHFRGFESSWQVPAGEKTAERGKWVRGPGMDLFARIEAELGHLPIVAEDLGVITAKVRQLRDAAGLPGMKVLQFAFDGNPRHPFLPHNYIPRCVVYTGTHDNDTTVGWFAGLSEEERGRVQRYLQSDGADIASQLIRVAYQSVAETAMVPMQDVLKLGSEARMNLPGRSEGNWGWRFRWDELDPARVSWLRELAATYGRVPAATPGTPPAEEGAPKGAAAAGR